jgi:hypothetical protein
MSSSSFPPSKGVNLDVAMSSPSYGVVSNQQC